MKPLKLQRSVSGEKSGSDVGGVDRGKTEGDIAVANLCQHMPVLYTIFRGVDGHSKSRIKSAIINRPGHKLGIRVEPRDFQGPEVPFSSISSLLPQFE